MQITQNIDNRALRPPAATLVKEIQPARESAARLEHSTGRFEIYNFLREIYRVYLDWRRHKTAKRSSRDLAHELGIVLRDGMSPIRVLIEATLPSADLKQKSRWVRALEYIASEDVPARQFKIFIRANGGLAGCARLAARVSRKRRRPGGDWND